MTLMAACVLLLGAMLSAPADEIPLAERRSGFDFMSRETQAMQREDAANPGMLWVGEGEALWNAKPSPAVRSCAECHGDAKASMRGVAARHPAFSEALARPVDLAQRINYCRQSRQDAAPLRHESKELLALTAFVGRQSRGMPMVAPDDDRLKPYRERGQKLFAQRIGQLNFSCANCHDDNWGKKLAGSAIPQGHANGYPIYRLEWQTLGSLQRRFRNCMTGVRAEPFAYGAPEFVELELFLAWRARGMPVETPAVRP